MKKTLLFLVITALISFFGYAQSIENIDFISPFHNDVAAIKKDGQWAFIDKKGKVVVNFRNDLISTKFIDKNYPVFKNERCIIVQKKDGILYFGYIDKTGKTVVEPQFLNAENFNSEVATVLKLMKDNVGKNGILGKNVVYYRYYEVIIDSNGVISTYLNPKGVNVVLDKKFLLKPPHFKSKQISKDLYAILNENKKWTVINVNE